MSADDRTEALTSLLTLYDACLTTVAYPWEAEYRGEHSGLARSRFEQVERELLDCQEGVERAQKRLLRTGYPVPDSWLTVRCCGAVSLGYNEPGNFHVLSYSGADAAALEAVCTEINAAIVRLEGEAGVPSGASDADAGLVVGAEPDGRRPAYGRDHLFLAWSAEGMTPARIRDRWNALPDDERKRVCSASWQRVGKGEPGRNVVKQAVLKAKNEKNS